MARLFLTAGQSYGTVGNFDTDIFGTNSNETVFLTANAIADFDPSFNRGGDIINIAGLAEIYTAKRVGSSIELTAANGALITIPVGQPTTINFLDASRTLAVIDGQITLGGQIITPAGVPVADGEFLGVFTLKESVVEGTQGTLPEKAIYWGYNPHAHGDDPSQPNAPQDGGVPLDVLVQYLTTITGLDLEELGLIDDDGVGPFDNVTNLSISNALNASVSAEEDPDDVPYLIITYNDGTTQNFAIEAQIAAQYFTFLNNLLFDEDGNSRLYEVDVPGTGSSGSSDYTQPIVLTTNQNNGGTIEAGFTTGADETIVAGRLELLHQAYINGGGGYNILEVDAKGLYAQPAALLNIQEVRINDLPNFYTTDSGSGFGDNGSGSNAFPSAPNSGNDNSWIDLNRALDLEKLVVTDQGSGGNSNGAYSGDLYIAGVRNGATLRLEGGFTSGSTTIAYGQGQTGVLNLELAVGTVSEDINILQNASVLNILSDGVANSLDNFFGGGNLVRLNVSGTGSFHVASDLRSSFVLDTPVTIDASQNSGGVDLTLEGPQNITILGSKASDRFVIQTNDRDTANGNPTNDETVTITGGAGNNYYQIAGAEVVTITNENGNNNYEVNNKSGQGGFSLTSVGIVTITTGNGNNHFELENVATANLTAGNGNNRIEVTSSDSGDYIDPPYTPDWSSDVDITVGNGKNVIIVDAREDTGEVTVRTGNGGNNIIALGGAIDIATTGAAPNQIYAYGESIKIANGASSGSNIIIAGANTDFSQIDDPLGGNDPLGLPLVDAPAHFLEDGALLNIQAGASATIQLGLEQKYISGSDGNNGVTLTALPGSVISGTNLTLAVNTTADLRAATLTGVTHVTLDDDNFVVGDATDANHAIAGGNASVLVLTQAQFLAIGAANFSVDGAIFNTHAFVKILVDTSTSLTALGVNNLPRNIDLLVEIQDNATLTLTAEQLHTRIAQNGITLADDGNTDYASGHVVVTGAGPNFDPFNTSDTVQTNIAGVKYYGGSLSSDFWTDTDGDGAVDPGESFGVKVFASPTGYNRPFNPATELVFQIDTDVTPEQAGFVTYFNYLEITGSSDITFTGPIELGVHSGTGTGGKTAFVIDFSDLEGEVINLTVDGFERLSLAGSAIYGNSDLVGDVEIFAIIQNDDDSTDGFDDNERSLVSKGVTKYTVVQIEGSATDPAGEEATIRLCDTTEDLEVIALRGNWNDTLIIENAAWGLEFELQGGGTLKAEGPTGTSNVGAIVANYQWDHADAVVNIIHANPADTRPIFAAGVTIDNADTLSITAPQGTVIIDDINGNSLEELTLGGSANVTVNDNLPDSLELIDASAVVGTVAFTVEEPTGGPVEIIGAAGGSTIELHDIDAGQIASIGGVGPITLNIGDPDGPLGDPDDVVDLSQTTLTNIDSVELYPNSDLTVTLDQANVIGAANFIVNDDDIAATNPTFLRLLGLDDQLFTLADYDPDLTITVMLADTQGDGEIVLNPGTDLTGIDSLVVPAGTTLFLTLEQFQQLNGPGTITGPGSLVITAVNQADVDNADPANPTDVPGLNLTQISVGGTITFALSGNVDLSEVTGMTENGVHTAPGLVFPGSDNGVVAKVDVFNVGAFDLTVGEVDAVDGSDVNGTAGSSLVVADAVAPPLTQIDASGFAVPELRFPGSLVANQNVDYLFSGLDASVTKIVDDTIIPVGDKIQNLIISAGDTVPGNLSVNDYQLSVDVTTLNLSLEGGAMLGGNLILSTQQVTLAGDGLVPKYLQALNIISEGTGKNTLTGEDANVISGNITPYGFPIVAASFDNQLKLVNITATQELIVGGALIYNSHGDDEGPVDALDGGGSKPPADGITANDDTEADVVLNVGGTKNVTIGYIDIRDNDIDTFTVNHTGTGTLTYTGGSPGIWTAYDSSYDTTTAATRLATLSKDTQSIILTGSGDIVIGNDTPADGWGLGDAGTDTQKGNELLTVVNASALSGDLNLGEIVDLNAREFTFTSGTGVTYAHLSDGYLDSRGTDATAGTADDTAGWTFNYSAAAAGSQFHIDADSLDDAQPGSKLTLNMGPNGQLFIDGLPGEVVDLRTLDLSITSAQPIVLADGVTLLLTAEQADGLVIISGPNTGPANAQVIVEVSDDGAVVGDNANPVDVDLSGIAVGGTIVFAPGEVDVTFAPTADLGDFAVALIPLDDRELFPRAGQTVRFATEDQANRAVEVVGSFNPAGPVFFPDYVDISPADRNSSNVIWLFENIVAANGIDTSDYDNQLGRLWFSQTLLNNEGGNVEDLFTTLPFSIIRIDFATIADALLSSQQVHRVLEVANFVTVNGVSFIDKGLAPDEHVRDLTLRLGGQTNIGAVKIGDVVAASSDPNSVQFDFLTFESRRALSDKHFLAGENYVNNNDGTIVIDESVFPTNVNTVGDISVGGAAAQVDLLQVNVFTYGKSAPAAGPAADPQTVGTDAIGAIGNDGADFVARILFFDSEKSGSTANLDLNGKNNITFKQLNFADPQITALAIDNTDHSGKFTVTGGSPAIFGGLTGESVLLNAGAGDGVGNTVDVAFGTKQDVGNNVPYAGIAGNEISLVKVDGTAQVNLGTIALIDSTDDLAFDINGDGDTADLNEGANIAFLLDGNGVANTSARLGTANVNDALVAPQLNTGQTWRFQEATVTFADDVTLQPGANIQLQDVALIIEGDVDFSEINLSIFGVTSITVPAGSSLTITIDQALQADMVNIVGGGTIFLVGDATLEAGDIGDHLNTAVVNASQVTIDNVTDKVFELSLDGARNDGNTADIGQTVIGSKFDDDLTLNDPAADATLDYVFDGGLGDDTYNAPTLADHTFLVKAGKDTITNLYGQNPNLLPTSDADDEQDIVIVSAGAEVTGTVPGEFFATSATSNAGKATFVAGNTGVTIDVSRAAGPNGYNLSGFDGDLPGIGETLVGSKFADVINGGGTTQQLGGADVLTGGAGNDVFGFSLALNKAANLTQVTTTPGVDVELIDITKAEGAGQGTGDETVTVNYTVGTGTPQNLVIALAAGVSESVTGIRDAIITALHAQPLISSIAQDADTVRVTGDGGAGLTINAVAFNNGAVNGGAAVATDNLGDDTLDVAQVTKVTVDGTPTPGDFYSIAASYSQGGSNQEDAIADGTPTTTEIAADLAFTDAQVDGVAAANNVTFTDKNADNGGFTLAFDTTAAFGGSGASLTLSDGSGGTDADWQSADRITDFTSGEDSISFGLFAGNASNYAEAANVADYATAYANANIAFAGSTGTLVYYLTSATDFNGATAGTEGGGLLFVDANVDGLADLVVRLDNITSANFSAAGIIA